jgi:D-alanyl-D-alanine carboxypeptidase (penicillin-binding protein 5/6)
MVTALVAMQRANLGDRVTIQGADLAVGSVMGLSAGEELTVEELLYGLLLPSDNVAASVIARHVTGSESTFVRLMNDWVAEMGLQDTHFANPHGMDQGNHYSSAYDLAQIARQVLTHPILADIVMTRERWAASRLMVNTNELLGQYPNLIGVKTGTTDAAGECLVAAVRNADDFLVSVVLGSRDRYADSRSLLDFYFERFSQVRLHLEQNALARRIDVEGNVVPLKTEFDGNLLLPRWQVNLLRTYRLIRTEETGEQPGNQTGKLVFYLCGGAVAELPLSVVEYP